MSATMVSDSSVRRNVSVVRMAGAGAISAGAAFVLCWIGAFVPLSSPTHAYVGLFTRAPITSASALVEGGVWSLLFGLLIGGLFALAYNVTAPLER